MGCLAGCVCACVWVCVHLKLGTQCTDAPIISLISGITLWGSDGSRHIFSQSGLFHQASGYFPFSAACGISPFSLHIIQKSLRISSQKEGQHSEAISHRFYEGLIRYQWEEGVTPWERALVLMSLYCTVLEYFWTFLSQVTESCELRTDFTSSLFFSCSRICVSSWRWGGSRWRELCSPLRRMAYWLWIRLWWNRPGKGSLIGWEKQEAPSVSSKVVFRVPGQHLQSVRDLADSETVDR